MKRSLEGYPGITPLSGLAGGCEAIARHLPVGSPVLLFALQRLAQRAQAILRKPGGLLQPGLDLVSLLAHLMLLIDYNVNALSSPLHALALWPRITDAMMVQSGFSSDWAWSYRPLAPCVAAKVPWLLPILCPTWKGLLLPYTVQQVSSKVAMLATAGCREGGLTEVQRRIEGSSCAGSGGRAAHAGGGGGRLR